MAQLWYFGEFRPLALKASSCRLHYFFLFKNEQKKQIHLFHFAKEEILRWSMVNGHVIFLQSMRHNACVEQSFGCIALCTFQCLFISVFFLTVWCHLQQPRIYSLNLRIFLMILGLMFWKSTTVDGLKHDMTFHSKWKHMSFKTVFHTCKKHIVDETVEVLCTVYNRMYIVQ